MKTLFIAGMAIIPGLFNPAAAAFSFEGLQAYSLSYCAGLEAESEADEAPEGADQAADQTTVGTATWVAYGCKDGEGNVIRRDRTRPASTAPGESK